MYGPYYFQQKLRQYRNLFICWYVCDSNVVWRKLSFFTGTTLIGISTLQTLISPYHKYWMPDLQKKKLQTLMYSQKLCYTGYEISANYPLFLNTKLDRNETISIFVAHSWISKIKHAQRLRIVDVYQIKNQINLHIS